MVIWTLIISVLPSLLLCWYIISTDRYEEEPRPLLVASFFFGVLSTFPAIYLERKGYELFNLHAQYTSTFDQLVFAFIVIALTEELVKFLFLRFSMFPLDSFNEPLDGIVYAMMISMGFACWENILYVVIRNGGIQTGILRSVTAVPAHAIFAVLMGYFVGLAKMEKGIYRAILLTVGFLIAVAFHGTYDFFIFQPKGDFLRMLSIPVLGIGMFISLGLINQLKEDSLARKNNENPSLKTP